MLSRFFFFFFFLDIIYLYIYLELGLNCSTHCVYTLDVDATLTPHAFKLMPFILSCPSTLGLFFFSPYTHSTRTITNEMTEPSVRSITSICHIRSVFTWCSTFAMGKWQFSCIGSVCIHKHIHMHQCISKAKSIQPLLGWVLNCSFIVQTPNGKSYSVYFSIE